MPLTSSVPEVGCCKSAITRSIVVLPQPDGPMKETNSPSATWRSTLDKASTRPSAVSNVSEIAFASTTSRLDAGADDITSTLLTDDGRNGRSPGGGAVCGSLTTEMLGFGDAISEVWQMRWPEARTMFAQPDRKLSRVAPRFGAV